MTGEQDNGYYADEDQNRPAWQRPAVLVAGAGAVALAVIVGGAVALGNNISGGIESSQTTTGCPPEDKDGICLNIPTTRPTAPTRTTAPRTTTAAPTTTVTPSTTEAPRTTVTVTATPTKTFATTTVAPNTPTAPAPAPAPQPSSELSVVPDDELIVTNAPYDGAQVLGVRSEAVTLNCVGPGEWSGWVVLRLGDWADTSQADTGYAKSEAFSGEIDTLRTCTPQDDYTGSFYPR